MTKKEQVVLKVERGEALTVGEIKIYQEVVKFENRVYGKYGTLKKKYLEEKGIVWIIADLSSYLHNVDSQANEIYETMFAKLIKNEKFKRTGEFMEHYRRQSEIQRLIEEEILKEIVYTENIG